MQVILNSDLGRNVVFRKLGETTVWLKNWSGRTRNHHLVRLHRATGRSRLAILIQTPRHQVCKVDSDFGEQICMLVDYVEAFLPDRGTPLHAAQLAAEQGVEAI